MLQKAKVKTIGFTLVELIITIAVLGIIAAIATPSMMKSINNYRMKLAVNSLDNLFNTARGQAVNHGSVPVTSADLLSWQVKYSNTTTGKTTDIMKTDINPRITVTNSLSKPVNIKFYKTGRSNVTGNTDFDICITGSGVRAYKLTLYASGSTRISRGAAC